MDINRLLNPPYFQKMWFRRKRGRVVEILHPDNLTVSETADLLQIPRSSVYKLARQGKIPVQKVGKHW